MAREITESNKQYLGAFGSFARKSANGDVSDFEGVRAMYARVPVFFLNTLGFNSPVTGEADLRRRVNAATCYARDAGHPYFISVCLDWLSDDARSAADAAFLEHGLHPMMQWTGMAADELLPARHEAPAELELRPVADSATRLAVNDINSLAYGMPAEPGREPLDREEFWVGMCGTVGYVDGTPVATATTLPVDGCLYVALVATHPDYQRRGYAETCMRDSLTRAAAESGLTRTVLHATDAGHPVYSKMGYHDVTKFQLYAEVHG